MDPVDEIKLNPENVILNPNNQWFAEFLRPYYIFTKDGQYLFASTQPGRRPDRAFYMIPKNYNLGWNQKSFNVKVGKKLYQVIQRYLSHCRVIVQDGIQGTSAYRTSLKVIISIENPHSAYIGWFGRLMVFPSVKGIKTDCWNYIIPERLPKEVISEIRTLYPEFDPDEPLTLYDFTEIDKGIRRVMSLRVDYFGGAYKKPNLTMIWNKAELDGLISYHAGATASRVMKGLSGTGKTTLTVGPDIQQDDACLGKLIYNGSNKVEKVQIIGLEAASFAKSEGLTKKSPEYKGLMKSRDINLDGSRTIVLALNIDCEGIEYRVMKIKGHQVKVPVQKDGEEVGSLLCTQYSQSGTTNGRFVFQFNELNPRWGKEEPLWLQTEALSFKRFDILEPIIRVTDPATAVALDSSCETIITSAISGQRPGTRVRRYAATDFMVGEEANQAAIKLRVMKDIGLDLDGGIIFFINNAGMVGAHDLSGRQIQIAGNNGNGCIDQGEKISVEDSKRLIHLVETNQIKNWIPHPYFNYLIPDPKELEEEHGLMNFRNRFNLLRYYTPEDILQFYQRDASERTEFLEVLFANQKTSPRIQEIFIVWNGRKFPTPTEIREFYETHYGEVN
ncbi:MAG: phosphoenolpyruvate carboxykinase (ATP) [Promethearchaeota archaeon]